MRKPAAVPRGSRQRVRALQCSAHPGQKEKCAGTTSAAVHGAPGAESSLGYLAVCVLVATELRSHHRAGEQLSQ